MLLQAGVMNGQLRLSWPTEITQKLTFGKHPPITRSPLYLSVLLGGKVSSRFVAQKVQYVGCRGVAMAPLVRPERRQVRLMDHGTVTGGRRSLLLCRSRGKLPFVTTGPRPCELRHRPCRVRLPNFEPASVSSTEQTSSALPVSPNSATARQHQWTEATQIGDLVGRRSRRSA